MDEDGRSGANGSPDTTITVAERWRVPALEIVQRWLPGRRWLRFAAAIEERHVATFVRSSQKRRDQARAPNAGSEDISNVAAGLVPGQLTPAGGARGWAGAERWPAAAPGRPRQLERQTGRPDSWAEANRPMPWPELRAALPRRAVGADAEGARADVRIDRRSPAGTLHGLARTLDPYVQGWLSGLLDLRIPAVRIHTGQAADATARRFNADAVSFGRDIMFRAGRFAPDSAAGLGLLGHELTHVAQTESDRFAGSLDREELAAIENERRVLQHVSGPPPMPAQLTAAPREPRSRPVTRAPVPRAASVDRAVAPPAADSDAPSSSTELTAQQLGALKEAVYRDLLDRIRTEFERGA